VKPHESREPVLVDLGVAQVGSEEAFDVVLPAGLWLRLPTSFRDGDLTHLLGVLSTAC
jgi:hypothetical protein